MGPHAILTNEKIPLTQVIWQVFEILMNSIILWTMLTIGVSAPLVLWTLFEVVVNFWILRTMLKVGLKKMNWMTHD